MSDFDANAENSPETQTESDGCLQHLSERHQ